MNVFDVLREKVKEHYEKINPYVSKNVVEIVNQVEQEYNNDFCEWKFEQTTGIVWHCDDKCTTYNLPYSTNLRIIADDFECKCPYCGKKIKVVSND